MEKLRIMTIMFLFAFGLFSTVAVAKPASVMLREGLYAEEVEGDIDAAIKIYEQIIQGSSASRNDVAQALYRQGMCYLKMKDEHKAKVVFGKLVAEYGDQTDIIEKAKPLLDDLMNYDPADLMPPGTLIYVEFGSPGKHIETMLNMLKGTPFENPLVAIGSGNMVGANIGQKSPADIMAALLNPSMMAEFKKIRGMAFGITAVRENNPPMVAVLYPGKSDALRGIILAALGVVGQRSEPIEGMEILNIQNVASVAYDNKVIIIAQPSEQLNWCIKQYKGITSEPTLASSNKSFTKISKKQRQNNVFTAWLDVDEAYSRMLKMFPANQIPKEVFWANTFADFSHIDYIIVSDSIEQEGFSDTTEIVFKEGHSCLAYDLIRTPNISKAALQAVPSDAVALASFALSQPDSVQANTVRAKIKNITGLDIGREIFDNVEQVAFFAVPPKQASPLFPGNIGLAVTSHNPQQTRQILAKILGTANAMLSGQSAATGQSVNELDLSAGRYQVGMVKGNPIYCYVEQVDKATILSINPDVTQAAVAALKGGNNVCSAGPLAGAVSKLPPVASKLVLVNAGGIVRLVAPVVIESFKEEQRSELQNNFDQIAAAADKTTLEIRTDEQLNSFAVNSKLTGLPPLNQIFGPAAQIAEVIQKVEAEAKVAKLRQAPPATIIPTATPPVIDGDEDDIWSAAPTYKVDNVLYSPPSSPNDLSAVYKAMWDENNLYLLVDVTDDVLVNDTRPDQFVRLPTGSTDIPWWYDDCVEVYIDADNSKSNQYDSDDAQYHFDWDKTNPTMGTHQQHGRTENIEFAMRNTEKGYRFEIKFPWATLGRKPSTGASIGLDVHINDDDDGGERDKKIAWYGERDNAWENPQAFGNGELAGLIGWWKLDETEGGTAKDSSGGNHDGTLNGDAKWTQGKIGGAVELDGSGDFIRISDNSAFNIAGQITIACWVNIRSVPHEWMAIVTKGDNSWRLSTLGNQRKFHTSVNDWQQLMVDGTTQVAANQWHHVAAVYDGQQMCIYVDGKVDICQPWKGGIGKNDYDVLIGENAQEKNRYFDGLIDDVRIYNYALKEVDIMALYNEGVKR